ncbi:hypothetical protein D1610_14375 [Sphingomonas gilva]|uniref:Zeta toxin domain-containing protein n=1 Tax=Sphingomonas gilva TaxID=2305907 RepID=A0A396RSL2_9SPHN|nr:zeta toxin family protein [Sphingomonas gilva]RHW16581.1 hypothetical protein D1610_14375 [Sphingomonas gilva]
MSLTPRRPERPILWMVAGPNGSGKSSLYNHTDIEGWGGSVWIINPDLLTAHILDMEHADLETANLHAVERIEEWLNASIAVYQTIGVETVLSSGKYRPLVERAKAAGFEVRMIYVLLESAQLQIDRVRQRVRNGGHDVPVDKIVARRRRSFEQFPWFAEHVDHCYVFDNSTGEPLLVAEKVEGDLMILHDLPSDLQRTIDDSGIFARRLPRDG